MTGEPFKRRFAIIQDQLAQFEWERKTAMSPRPLVWVHLPKCGGSTLQDVVVRQYRGGYGFRFTGSRAQLAAFKALPAEVRGRFDLLHGHVHFGLHRWLPDPAVYLTMLRDPVERVISHYYFVLKHPEHYVHSVVAGKKMSLKEYAVGKPTHEIDNDMVRWLTDTEHFDIKCGRVTRGHCEEAKWNLENAFSAFGLTERFDESLVCIGRAMGWADVSYEELKNVNRERPRNEEISQDTVDAIREANRYDVELYEFAKVLFEEQLIRLGVIPGATPGVGEAGRGEPSAAREPALA